MALPEDRYYEALCTAGKQIDAHAKELAGSQFRWLKSSPSRPAFADLIFALGSKIYAILIVECKSAENLNDSKPEVTFSIPEREQMLLIEECEANNLIPVICPLYLDAMQMLSLGWNLFSLPDMKSCDPMEGGIDTTPVPMSKWEMCSFRVQMTMSEIEKEGNKILSYQDIPGIMPNIWFEDAYHRPSWVAVIDKADDNAATQEKLEDTARRIPFIYSGYVAKLAIKGQTSLSPIPMRGEMITAEYEGLEKVEN